MSDEPAAVEAELSRRLSDLAATTTFDPEALDRIVERAGSAPGRGPGWSPRWLLAVAAMVVTVVGAGALLLVGAQAGSDDVEMSDDPATTTEDAPDRLEEFVPTSTTIPTTTTAPPVGTEATVIDGLIPVTGPACPSVGEGTVCVGVDRGDVDGDGRTDDVALVTVPPHEFDLLPITVRVRYADGDVEESTVDGIPFMADLMGVTDLDGDGREEIAFFTDGGAHNRLGLFMGTTATDRLHLVGFREPQSLADGAALFSGGFSCPDIDGDGRNELVISGSYADPATGVGEIETHTYRWEGDLLKSEGTSTEPVAYGDTDGDGVEDFREIGGAQCGDLVADL